jgi:hypothetical protein
MGNQHNLSKRQLLDHSVQIQLLIFGGIGLAMRLIRSSPPEKIKNHYPARW